MSAGSLQSKKKKGVGVKPFMSKLQAAIRALLCSKLAYCASAEVLALEILLTLGCKVTGLASDTDLEKNLVGK